MSSVRLRFEHSAPAASARSTARRALEAWKATQVLDDLLLVVTELVQNVSRHTSNGGELVLSLHGDTILVEVRDASPVLPHMCKQDPRRVGGRGLPVVAAVARRWGARTSSWAGRAGKVVWAELAVCPAV
jgi:anti-sigma regulatory factor (Ser/Thr protein kinase)